MQPTDRLVCVFVKTIDIGGEFKAWPLHVTVVPWFRLSAPSNDLKEELQQALGGIQSFEVEMGAEAQLGHKKGKVGNWVRLPSPLIEIEKRVRQVLKTHNSWLVDETTRLKRDYRPHVTAQAEERLHEGDRFICSKLHIIEQKGDYKEIVQEINLG